MPATQRDRRCVFCGGKGLTREHVLPDWSRELTAVRRALQVHQHPGKKAIPRGRYVPALNTVEISVDMDSNDNHPSLVKVKQVCKSCNNGWMSRLENRVKPTLIGLAEDNQTELERSVSEGLAFWAAKTAMMFEFNDIQTRVFSAAQVRDIYERRVVPRQTEVFVGEYEGNLGSRLRHHQMHIHQRGGSTEPIGLAGITGIALGRAAFLVRTIVPASLGPLERVVEGPASQWQRIWPETPAQVILQGPAMDDDDFNAAVPFMELVPSEWQ